MLVVRETLAMHVPDNQASLGGFRKNFNPSPLEYFFIWSWGASGMQYLNLCVGSCPSQEMAR
jgi:hypothetical protein